MVTVLDVDIARKRISLSMKGSPAQTAKGPEQKVRPTRDQKSERKESDRKGTAQPRFSNSPFAEALKNK
jgi:ribosomal protein S1